MTHRKGQCLCGAVTFEISDLNPEFGACHCKMCQRWAGSALLALTVPADTLKVEGTERIGTYPSSEWAERSWCTRCGSGLWYRLTVGPEAGTTHIPIGLLDDPSGLKMIREIFIDQKIDAISFEGQRELMTAAEVFAKYGGA